MLAVIGIGSLGYAAVLARASRGEHAARAICPPTAVANAVTAVAPALLMILLRGDLTALGVGVLVIAAVGCALFAGAEATVRPVR